LCADRRDLDDVYVYLLGIYLGDGMLTQMRRNVWRLRIFQDQRYPQIIQRIRWAIETVSGNPSSIVAKVGCYEIFGYWKHWWCLFPQHGPGMKHTREIVLEPWQRDLVKSYPHELIRGLVQSDGCRAINRVRRPTLAGLKRYAYVRYFFTNASPQIRELFGSTCREIGVACRPTTERVLSVAQRESVAILDSFIGPKR
jgi:hypothetical protein